MMMRPPRSLKVFGARRQKSLRVRWVSAAAPPRGVEEQPGRTPAVPPGYRWLDAGVSNSPIIGAKRNATRLHPQLRRLENIQDNWLRVEPCCYARDVALKAQVFDDPVQRAETLVETGSDSERETFELVASFLARKHPRHFVRLQEDGAHSGGAGDDKVAVFDDDGVRGDKKPTRVVDAGIVGPLEAAARLAQEDLFVLSGDRLVSAACVFSFGGVKKRARERQSMDDLHRNVGGYKKDISHMVRRAVTSVKPDAPVWRTNWSISLSPSLRPVADRDFLNVSKRHAVHGDSKDLVTESVARRNALAKITHASSSSSHTTGVGAAVYCKVEYQTLRRLTTGDVLFTVHTYLEPLETLTPNAARHLATNVGLAATHDVKTYKNLSDPTFNAILLEYLHRRAAQGGDGP